MAIKKEEKRVVMKKLYQLYLLYKKREDTKVPLWFRITLPVIGFIALVWFLVRVIPKPSRATYPCQRIAFPLASSFIIWLIGITCSFKFLVKARKQLIGKKVFSAVFLFLVSIGILWMSMSMTSTKPLRADEPVRNQPIGLAKGIHPGRVVWIHDPNATDWEGPGIEDEHSWQPEHTSQKNVDAMVAKSIKELSGCDTDGQAWDAIFRYFNQQQGKGDVGYVPGEKITVKVNLTTCNSGHLGSIVDPETFEKVDYLDKSDTSPQMIVALLRQLVFKAGVDPNDIAVGDTLCVFPTQWWDICHGEFPDATFFDQIGDLGRVQSVSSSIRQYWSELEYPNSYTEDYIPALYVDAAYLINLAVLKGHAAGITLCAKNHYGSYDRTPIEDGYYDLHESIAGSGFNPLDGQYRALVDIMGHPHIGGKTLLYMLDGLYGGYKWEGTPYKLQNDPFNDDWPSSLLVSLDPVAIDSVGMDILWEEWPTIVQVGGVDDYLKEAALAASSPSGTFYDPDGNSVGLASLGVYERWNNSTDRQYSRNLGTGNGIELVYVKMQYRSGDINSDRSIDIIDLIQLTEMWLWGGSPEQIPEDIYPDGQINLQDFSVLSQSWE